MLVMRAQGVAERSVQEDGRNGPILVPCPARRRGESNGERVKENGRDLREISRLRVGGVRRAKSRFGRLRQAEQQYVTRRTCSVTSRELDLLLLPPRLRCTACDDPDDDDGLHSATRARQPQEILVQGRRQVRHRGILSSEMD